jgi:hypothetical protein
MTSFMRSKPVDIFVIVLILLYSLLVVVYLAISDEIEERPTVLLSLQITELVFLFIFWVEISLNIIGFGMLFIKDRWNIADITVIFLAILFVILDMTLGDSSLSGLFKLRGLFRLLRLGILLRKFDSIRKKSQARKRMQGRDIYHVASPVEIVNEILCEVRDMIDNDERMLEDVNYCIKMVSSGKLYEANIGENNEGADDQQKEAINFFKSYQGKGNGDKRDSTDSRQIIESKIDTIDVVRKLDLSKEAISMLKKVDTLDFNIFDFKDAVAEKGNTYTR